MPIDLSVISLGIGQFASLCLIAMILWSILFPQKRLWPPVNSTPLTKAGAWGLTILVFGSAFITGIWDWNALGWSLWFRWPIGLGLLLAGNFIVWRSVFIIGMEATSGGKNQLATDGLYQWSRNPQYMADVGILVGWAILSGSLAALPIIGIGIVALLIAPLAEEPWLEATYGDQYRSYKSKVGRYFKQTSCQ